ncbi:hypothetical protein D047_1349, partial [Vibrio parahaemolyticus VPTS-2010_2]
MLEHISSL